MNWRLHTILFLIVLIQFFIGFQITKNMRICAYAHGWNDSASHYVFLGAGGELLRISHTPSSGDVDTCNKVNWPFENGAGRK